MMPPIVAAMISHVPNKRDQMVLYYGYYSNVSGGLGTGIDLLAWTMIEGYKN